MSSYDDSEARQESSTEIDPPRTEREAARRPSEPVSSSDTNASEGVDPPDNRHEGDDSINRDQDIGLSSESATYDETDSGYVTGLTVEHAEAETVNIVGQQNIGKQTIVQHVAKREPLRVATIGRDVLEMRSAVFSAPTAFAQASEVATGSHPRRVVIILGPEHGGKMTCALKWAQDHCPTPESQDKKRKPEQEIVAYSSRDNGEYTSLADAVISDSWPKGKVVIIEDAFSNGVNVREIGDLELRHLTETLEDKESYLILTTELRVELLEGTGVLTISTEGLDLAQVFRNHLRYYCKNSSSAEPREPPALVEGTVQELTRQLSKPYLLDRLCSKIPSLASSTESIEPDLVALAVEIGRAASLEAQTWFQDLSTNEKTLSLLLYLFEGADLETLALLHHACVERLRKSGLGWVRDPRTLGILDMLDRVTSTDFKNSVRIESDERRRELRRQATNRRALLWSALHGEFQRIESEAIWLGRDQRFLVARAFARLGESDLQSFRSIISGWAQNRIQGKFDHTVASMAGQALAHLLALEPQTYWGFVDGILEEWTESGEPSLRWSAAAATWRVFRQVCRDMDDLHLQDSQDRSRLRDAQKERLLEHIENIAHSPLNRASLSRLRAQVDESESMEGESREVRIRKLIGRMLYEIRRACAFALVQMGLDDRKAISRVLAKWLCSDTTSLLHQLALEATVSSFKTLAPASFLFGFEANRDILLLLRPLLERTSITKGPVLQAFTVLAHALEATLWREALEKELLLIANRTTSRGRTNLEKALSLCWLPSRTREVVELAQALIARCKAMEGVIIDRPDFGSALLAIDNNFFCQDLAPGAGQALRESVLLSRRGAAWQLAALLEAQLPLAVVRLGKPTAQIESERGSSWELESPSETHRLLMPAVDALDRPDLRLLLALTTGELPDLPDFLAGHRSCRVLVIDTSSTLPLVEGVQVIHTGRDLSSEGLSKVEEWLSARWAEALANATREEWRPVARALGYDLSEPAEVQDILAQKVLTLDAIESAGGRDDRARALLVVLLWFAAADLEAAASLLRDWLERPSTAGPEGELRQCFAAAGARALLRIHSAVPLTSPAIAELLFGALAGALAAWSEDGTHAVLKALGEWLEEPAMAAYFAGDNKNGKGRLLQWAEAHAPERAPELGRALRSLEKAARREEHGADGSALLSAFDRIQFSAAGGRPEPVPELEDQERLGLIVVDPESSNDRLSILALNLVTHLESVLESKLTLAVARLGEGAPGLVRKPGDEHSLSLRVPTVKMPPLLGSILEGPVKRERVAFVLTLVNDDILDMDDWAHTSWSSLLYTYPSPPTSRQDRPWTSIPTIILGDEAEGIGRFLSERCGLQLRSADQPEAPTGPSSDVN